MAPAAAPPAPAPDASTTPIDNIASGSTQADAVKAAIKDLEAKVKMVERHVKDEPDDQHHAAKLAAFKADLAAKKAELGGTKSPTEAAHNAGRDVIRFRNTVEKSGQALKKAHAESVAADKKCQEAKTKHEADLAKLANLEG